jgi:hypothetical protein
MTQPRKLLQAERVRRELEDWLSRFDLEIRLGSPPRHLDPIGQVCALLIEKLVRVQGETLETNAFADRLQVLAQRGLGLWKRPPVPTPGQPPKLWVVS